MTNNAITPDPANIQGLILKGYSHPCSCHLLFKFPKTSENTRAFFNTLFDDVQSAKNWEDHKPVSMLNIGLTAKGIDNLDFTESGTESSEIDKDLTFDAEEFTVFPNTFKEGPAAGGAQASLNDGFGTGSAPRDWWGSNGKRVNANLHCIIHVYGLTDEDLNKLVDKVLDSATENGLTEFYPLANDTRLYQTTLYNNPAKVHFGYTDAISEPALTTKEENEPAAQEDLNNFIIGYADNSITLPGPTNSSKAARFAKDGCYNAFRVLWQDVGAFNKFLHDEARSEKNISALSYLELDTAQLEEWFAAKLCGRWRNGSPLMDYPNAPSADVKEETHRNDFGYSDSSITVENPDIPSGSKCPFSAHVRATNTRDQQLHEGTDPDGSPRIIRRGVPYGPHLDGIEGDGIDRGLIGLFLCGDLASQFEKLYSWMNFNDFSDVFDIQNPPQDALLGNRPTEDQDGYSQGVLSFSIPLEDDDSTTPSKQRDPLVIDKLPQFVGTRGTAYCLLPSMETLAKIAGRQ
jgi:hypothetical protein